MRILLVEDDQRIAGFVAKGLREQSYAVDVTSDGDDAVYKLSINDYDAVILDVMIPGRDGFEVCRELRAAGSAIPIIMLTARDTVQDRITGLDSGADDYLTKPFAVAELLARLRALLRRGHIVRPAKIQIADLLLDTRAKQATRGGRQLPLTTKEYALLDYLAREQGRVVSRAEIAEHVWGQEFDPFSNLI
ncbi:MAG: response regulator transcription factor, partial [bacterium]